MLECVVSTYITVYIHIILKYKFLGVIIAFFFLPFNLGPGWYSLVY